MLLTPRYTTKRFNPLQPRHPAGTIIGGIAVGGRWARVLGRGLGSRRRSGGSAASAPAGPDPLAPVRTRAREQAKELLGQVREYYQRFRAAGYQDDSPELRSMRTRITQTTGVDVAALGQVVKGDEVTEQELAQLMASRSDWEYYIPSREIRRAAHELAGFETELTDVDPHLDHDASPGRLTSGYSSRRRVNVEELRRMQAYVLMRGVRDAPRFEPGLYRGVDLRGTPLPEAFKEGAIIELPLASFTTHEDVAANFGIDVTFVVRNAKAIRGGEMEAPAWLPIRQHNEFFQRYDPREYVTGGRFRIVRIETRPPRIPPYPQYPDDPDDVDAMNAYLEARELVSPYYDQWGRVRPEYQVDTYLIELEQVGVYDPDSGQLVEEKAAGEGVKPKVPDYDWMFDASLAAAQRSRRRGR